MPEPEQVTRFSIKIVKIICETLTRTVYLLNNSKTNYQMTTAQTILQQLGGGKFIAMTGAACFADGETLVVKFKGSKVANLMHVTLTALDLYTVKFFKYRGMNVAERGTFEMVYNDQLQNLFTKTTGLYTSL